MQQWNKGLPGEVKYYKIARTGELNTNFDNYLFLLEASFWFGLLSITLIKDNPSHPLLSMPHAAFKKPYLGTSVLVINPPSLCIRICIKCSGHICSL